MWDFRCGAECEECVRTPAVFALKAWESNSEHNSTGRHGIGTECDEMLSVSVLEVPKRKILSLGIFIGIIGGKGEGKNNQQTVLLPQVAKPSGRE